MEIYEDLFDKDGYDKNLVQEVGFVYFDSIYVNFMIEI